MVFSEGGGCTVHNAHLGPVIAHGVSKELATVVEGTGSNGLLHWFRSLEEEEEEGNLIVEEKLIAATTVPVSSITERTTYF